MLVAVVRRPGQLLTVVVALALLAACQNSSQEATPTPTATTAAQPAPTQTPTSTPTPTGLRNKIAYVSNDFDIYTINPDGSDKQVLTPRNALYTWPTWSLLGDSVAYSSFSEDPLGPGKALYSLSVGEDVAGNETARLLFENDPNTAPAIGLTIPHYAAWSPDGKKLAFLAMASKGLSLYVAMESGEDKPQFIASGSPFYFTWSNDSESLLLHKEGELLRVDLDAPSRLLTLEATSMAYRAPAWSPVDDITTFISSEGGVNTLYLARFDGSRRQALSRVEGVVSFAWSPDGGKLAMGQSMDDTDPFLRDIQVIDVATGQKTDLFEGPVLSFFWSPDSSKLAFVTTNGENNALQWRVADLVSGARTVLTDFQPSGDQLTLLTFFDQYTVSHRVWSPDSKHLLFAGALVEALDPPSGGSPESEVFILDASGEEPPLPLAFGRLATWSWQ